MPTIETEISDEEPRTDADIVLVINYDETKGVVVENKIHHSKLYPSVIKLPFIKQ